MSAGSWTRVPFLETVEDATGGHRKTKQRDYLANGRYPIIDQGQDLIGGYTDDASMLSRVELPVVIFGDHTRCVKFVDFPFGAGADGVKVLRPRPGFDARFLYYFTRSIPLHDGGYSRHFKYLKEATVPLPPIREQRRIAAVLDVADALRAKRRQALAKLDTLTQAIFIDMFGGGGRAPTNPGPTGTKHPNGWSWVPIADVAGLGTGHTPDRAVPGYWGGDVGWVNLNEIRKHDGRWCTETEIRITSEGVAHSSAVIHPTGTVCFSRTASIGFVTIMAKPMATSQDFVTWTCGDELNPDFLMHALLVSRASLRSSSSGSTHKTIYVRDAQRFRVLLPPRRLQDEFVERAACARVAVATMESEVAPLEALFASLQQRAFRGEL
jgi:type I restriction enzyme S subunit